MQRTPSSHLTASGSTDQMPGPDTSGSAGGGKSNRDSPSLRPRSPSNLAPPHVPFHLLASDDQDEDAAEPETAAPIAQPSSPADSVGPPNTVSSPDASLASIASNTLLPLTSLFSSFALTVSALAGGTTTAGSERSGTALSLQATPTPTITTPDAKSGSKHRSNENVTSSLSRVHRTSDGSMHVSSPRRPLPPSLSRSSSHQMSGASIHGAAASSGTSSAIRRTPSMVAANTPLPNSGSHSQLPNAHALCNSYHYSALQQPASLARTSRSRNASLVLPTSASNHSHGHLTSSTSSTHLDPAQGALHDVLMQQLADRDARIAQLEEQLRHLSSADMANQRLIADLEHQISELTTGKRQVTQDLAVAKRELATNLTTLAKAQDERDTHLARVRDLESDLDRVKQIANGLSERLALTESRLSDAEQEETEAKQQVEYWQQNAEELHGICDRLTAELEHRESILGEIDMGLSHALGEQLRRASPTGSSRAESPVGQLQATDDGLLKVSSMSINDSTMTLQASGETASHTHIAGSDQSASGQREKPAFEHTISPPTTSKDHIAEQSNCRRASTGTIHPTLDGQHLGSAVTIHAGGVHMDHNASARAVPIVTATVASVETTGSSWPTATLHVSDARTATISTDSIQTQVASIPSGRPDPVQLTPLPNPPGNRRQRSLQDELMDASSSPPPPEPSSSPVPLELPIPAVQQPQPKVKPQLHAILASIASRVYKHRQTLNMSDADFDSFLGFLDEKAGVTFVHVLRAIASSGSNADSDDDDLVGIRDSPVQSVQRRQEQSSERPPDSAYVVDGNSQEPTPGKFELSKHSLADLLRQDDDDGHEHASCGCHSHSDSHLEDLRVEHPSALQASTPSPPAPIAQQQSLWRSVLAVYALNLLHITGARVKQATIPNDIDNPRLGKHVVFSVSPTPETGLFKGKLAVLNGWIGGAGRIEQSGVSGGQDEPV